MQGAATSTTTTSTHASSGHGSSATMTPAAERPTSAGSTRPRRSERRPMTGLSPASSAAATKNVAADHRGRRAELVEPQRRQHVERAEHQADEHDQPHRGPDPRLAQRAQHGPDRRRRPCGEAAPGVCSAHTSRPAPASATALNTISGPRPTAAAPSTGPPSAPHDRRGHRRADQLAAALARRGADQPADRARPRRRPAEPLHEAGHVEDDDAARERERERGRDRVASPSTTVGRTPIRAVSQPPGSAPRNVPAGYAAARIPAPVLVRSNSAA